MVEPREILPDAPPDAVALPVEEPEAAEGEAPVWRDVHLSRWEYQRIVERLGRRPNRLELEMFGGMWSEHCSYKNSRALLGRLPTGGDRVVQGPGENAGAIRVGERIVVFKIESHNSPSAAAPFDGAATGVGGILRDVFAMGARPVAVLDSLRLGPPEEERQRRLFDGVSAGVAAYAAGMGVPNVASEVRWDAGYRQNVLVNAMAVGVVEGPLARGAAEGPGNKVLVYGRPTGRDGVRSATFSSKARADDDAADGSAPVIPAGDPEMGRRVMEATLALLATGAVVGLQDMGAAGFTSSACEMAARAGTGIEIDVALAPTVDDAVEPYEVMLSETQERMLAVVAAGREEEVRAVLERHQVPYAFCGVVTDDGIVRVKRGGDVLAEVPARLLADEAPCYVRPLAPPPSEGAARPKEGGEGGDSDWTERLRQVLSSPNVGSLRRLRARYGAEEPGVPRAAVVDLGPGPESGLALSVYGNGRYVASDPYVGAQLCVAAAARRVAATGARPAAVTNGLNFGSPENPEVYWQMERTVAGMADACRALGTPVTGGNVSLYNETGGVPVLPTPIIGMVGVLAEAGRALPPGFRQAGNAVLLLGATGPGLGGSEYEAIFAGEALPAGAEKLPRADLERERQLYDVMAKLADAGLPVAAAAVADGGLAATLAHMSFAAAPGAAGCHISLEPDLDPATALFGESPGRIVLEAPIYAAAAVVAAAAAAGVPCTIMGRVVDGSLKFVDGRGRTVVEAATYSLADVWEEAVPHPWTEDGV